MQLFWLTIFFTWKSIMKSKVSQLIQINFFTWINRFIPCSDTIFLDKATNESSFANEATYKHISNFTTNRNIWKKEIEVYLDKKVWQFKPDFTQVGVLLKNKSAWCKMAQVISPITLTKIVKTLAPPVDGLTYFSTRIPLGCREYSKFQN